MDTQTKIDLELPRFEGDRYAEELAEYEKTKKNKSFHPVFFCFLPSTKKFSATRFASESLLKSFGFQIIHHQE
jgi:hypothetical protein